MAEPQPSPIHEGATTPPAPTSTASDLKAQALLSALDAQEAESTKKEVDGQALDKAMKGLSVQNKPAASERKNVKVEPADVTLLVNELEVSKAKAMDLLRAHEGDVVRAMSGFVMAAP
ncbi:hypothetical protein BDW02DRAFT_626806 [Decorospora gaudefroyi]|uniref:Nascent polypeptide-associated complex subunit alpha-like UBA domain-containing protein n=1 Tax=Decorospora gaudefroyi TaxID=184978 RepID=A0A6A5KUV0_9PLEO|nr:hypothetical protein BDW02DRAFT_626806 [Decorospora gaudefroyi]